MPPPTVPVFQLFAAFGQIGQSTGPPFTEISAYMRNFTTARTSTRQQGPIYEYNPGTLSALLKNDTANFDPDNLHGPYVTTTGLLSQTVILTSGSTWTAPNNLVGTADVICVGGGGGGGGAQIGVSGFNGGGGGGAEYAEEATLAVTAGFPYTYSVGAPGIGGLAGQNGTNGGTTTFAGDAVTVTAHGGTGGNTPVSGQGTGGAGGTGSANTIAHAGGAGGTAGRGGGGGGGSSGGSTQAGVNGGTASSTYPGYGGHAVTGGGAGGGRTSTGYHYNGFNPGGGGAGAYNNFVEGFSGGTGYVIIQYVVTVPAAAMTEVLPNVLVQLSAWWPVHDNGIYAPLFTGFTDAWTDSGLNIPAYAETTMTATDGQKFLALAALPSGSAVGAGEDSGARVTRILNAAGWNPFNQNVTPGDTVLQGETYGDFALNRIQVTSDTEFGEFYIDVDGTAFFRHRDGLYRDFRSVFPCAIFSDVISGAGPSGSSNWWDFEDGTTQSWTGVNATVANDTSWAYGPGASKSLLITATSGSVTNGFFQAKSPAIPVIPGELHGAEATLWVSTSAPDKVSNATLQIDWHDASDVYVSSSLSPDGVNVPGAVPAWASATGNEAIHLSVQAQRVPPGCFNAHVTVMEGTSAAAGSGDPAGTELWVDYVLFDPMLKYTKPTRAMDATTLVNDVQYTRVGGTLQEVKSLTSIVANQGVLSYSRTDVMYNSDADALKGAQWVLSVSLQSEDRVDQLDILPQGDPYGIMPHALQRRIGDKIRVIRNPPNMITPLIRDLFITGISLAYDASAATFTVSWTTKDVAKYGALITLDDPVNGRVDYGSLAY